MPFVSGGANLYGFHVHTFLQALAFVPVGLVLLPLTHRARASAWRRVHPAGEPAAARGRRALGSRLCRDRRRPRGFRSGRPCFGRPHAPRTPGPRRRRGVIIAVLVVIWAAASRSYFWPIWPILPFAAALGMHAWLCEVRRKPALVAPLPRKRARWRAAPASPRSSGCSRSRSGQSPATATSGRSGHCSASRSWSGSHAAVVLLSTPQQLVARIESLTASRAGAVDLQDSDLRRIERDLHDGAQARLVALGMSLGMAEQKLAEDPDARG